eukprot:2215930-Prymnesium_polylepis.1
MDCVVESMHSPYVTVLRGPQRECKPSTGSSSCYLLTARCRRPLFRLTLSRCREPSQSLEDKKLARPLQP